MPNFRKEKLEHLLRNFISNLIIKNKIKDPRVTSLVSITRIEISKDTAYAKIWISGFEGLKSLKKSVDGLNSAAGFIQAQINKEIHLKNTPKLTFYVDTSLDSGFKLNQKIEDNLTW